MRRYRAVRCESCNFELYHDSYYCDSCGNRVSDSIIDGFRSNARGSIISGGTVLVVICVAWATLNFLLSYGWLIAVVNIGLLLLSVWVIIRLRKASKFLFLFRPFGGILSWLLPYGFGFFMIGIFRGILVDILEAIFN